MSLWCCRGLKILDNVLGLSVGNKKLGPKQIFVLSDDRRWIRWQGESGNLGKYASVHECLPLTLRLVRFLQDIKLTLTRAMMVNSLSSDLSGKYFPKLQAVIPQK